VKEIKREIKREAKEQQELEKLKPNVQMRNENED